MTQARNADVHEQPVAPSPAWFGALPPLLLLAATLVFLTYSLLDVGWQQRLGAWNYVLALALVVLIIPAMRLWRGDFAGGWRRGATGRARVRENVEDLRTLGRMFTRRP